MGEACQPLECLDTIYGSARSCCDRLEPGFDWALGVGHDCAGRSLDMG